MTILINVVANGRQSMTSHYCNVHSPPMDSTVSTPLLSNLCCVMNTDLRPRPATRYKGVHRGCVTVSFFLLQPPKLSELESRSVRFMVILSLRANMHGCHRVAPAQRREPAPLVFISAAFFSFVGRHCPTSSSVSGKATSLCKGETKN